MANFIKNYLELEQAFRFKRKNPSLRDYLFKENGRLEYEKKNGIFDQARNRFFNHLPLPKDDMEMVNQILNTIDGKDLTLEQYLNPHKTIITEGGQALPADGSSEQIAPGEPATTLTGGISTPSVSPVIRNIPQANIASTPQTETAQTKTPEPPQQPAELPKTRRSMLLNPQVPASVVSLGKNTESSFGIFLKKSGNRIVLGLGSIFGGAARGGGRLLIGAGGFGADALGQASNQISRGGAFKSPPKKYFAAIFGVIFFMIIFGIFTGGSLTTGPGGTGLTAPGATTSLAVSLAGPGGCIDDCQALNNQEITYEISLTYQGLGSADIVVSGQIPDKVSLDQADAENWSISGSSFSQDIQNLAANENRKLPLTFKPNSDQEDFWTNLFVSVSANITKTNLPGGTIGDSNIPPSDDTCAGKYTDQFKSNPSSGNKNFGDPTCTYSDDDLYTFLALQDPNEAPFWWLLVDCESTYRPNIVNISAEDKAGAWGLFQMGRGKNGLLDHGDVAWIKQISNAIAYKNSLESGPAKYRFRGEESYWSCARPGGLK